MDTWRLSRIEDELGKLDFTQDPGDPSLSDAIFSSLPTTLGFVLNGETEQKHKSVHIKEDEGYSEEESLPPPPDELPPPPDDLLYPPPESPIHTAPGQSDDIKSMDYNTKGINKSKEIIYSETCISKNESKVQSDAIKHITGKYDSLQRLKLTPFPSVVPPGYVNTKSPKKNKSVIEPPTVIPPTTANTTHHSDDDMVVPEASLSEIRDTNTWLEMEGKGRVPALDDQLLGDRLSNQCFRRGSHVSSLSEQEIMQVDMFYRSHKTSVFVCQCETDLYHGSVRDSKQTFDNFYSDNSNTSGWSLLKAGIPALVLDKGARKLHLILAERGTGFTLWKETVSHLTEYTAVQPNFHTLHLAADHSQLAGLSFQDASSASEFLQKLHSIINNKEDDILNLSNGKNKKKKKDKKSVKVKKPNKADISAPCCFTHVTALDRNDGFDVTTGHNATT